MIILYFILLLQLISGQKTGEQQQSAGFVSMAVPSVFVPFFHSAQILLQQENCWDPFFKRIFRIRKPNKLNSFDLEIKR